ncbi:MAG: site-specific DNA-methyltransferase, partial [Candidatus Azambacteria bacterium]|nr:site-specific DNA-methyltransferase [Candidatus Azambacteria bacterium]
MANEITKDKLILGDNLDILKTLKDESVDLIYIDPPFFSNKNYEVVFGDEAEIRSFEDRWEGGMNVYVEWMKERVKELYRVLKPTGSFYLHCDYHAGHYLKVMCDEIFGIHNFRNEIIWYYYNRWTAGNTNFQRLHDLIFRYSKSPKWKFNIQYQPYSETMEEGFQKQGFVKRSSPLKGDYVSTKKEGVAMHDVWEISFIHSQS